MKLPPAGLLLQPGIFHYLSHKRFPRGEAAPVRTLGLKRNTGAYLTVLQTLGLYKMLSSRVERSGIEGSVLFKNRKTDPSAPGCALRSG